MMSKYIEFNGKHAFVVNQRHPKEANKKPFCALHTLGLVKMGYWPHPVQA